MKRPEQSLQIECVKWFRYQYPKAIIHHSPNGGARSKVEGAIFKAMGVLAGFPDLIILVNGNAFFIELKAGKGKHTDAQNEVADTLASMDFYVWTARSFDEFQKIVNQHIKPYIL